MNPNEFGLYMIILPHEARFCTIFGKIFKENEKSQPLWLTLNDLYFALNMDFQRKKPIFAYKTSYFQFGTLKYIDVFQKYARRGDYSRKCNSNLTSLRPAGDRAGGASHRYG